MCVCVCVCVCVSTQVDLAPLSQPELTALFINLYNTLIIHAIVVLGQPDNPAKRAVFYTRDAAYCIAGHTYTGMYVCVCIRLYAHRHAFHVDST